jgi:ATP-dependent RNA helicase DeaD
MKDPVSVQVAAVASTNTNIEQFYAVVPFSQKTVAAHRLIISAKARGIIIFTRTRRATDAVAVELMGLGISAAAISGDVPQNTRENIVKRLRSGMIRVLVATDVAARGLDIDSVELVINYDLPDEPELYVHRIGRTGRAGRKGQAISFVTPREVNGKLKGVEKLIKQKLEEIQIPTASEVSKKLVKNYFDLIGARVLKGRLEHYVKAVEKKLEDVTTQEDLLELIAASIALGLGDDGDKPEPTRNEDPDERVKGSKSRSRSGSYSGGKSGFKSGGRSKPRSDSRSGGRSDSRSDHGSGEKRRYNDKGFGPKKSSKSGSGGKFSDKKGGFKKPRNK